MHDQIIEEGQFTEERDRADDIFTDEDVFEESRDEYPLREMVLESVEVEMTHPAGYGTNQDLSDGISARSDEWADELTASDVPEHVVNDFARELEQTVLDYAEEMRSQIWDEIEQFAQEHDWEKHVPEDSQNRPDRFQKADAWMEYRFDSSSELQSYIKELAVDVGVPESA